MTTIYLLRHGATDWNRQQRLQGTVDIPLNEAGVQQARQVARRLGHLQVSAVFTSPLQRALDTAWILASSKRWPVIADDRLREIDHGTWTGMRINRIAERFPSEFACWQLRPENLWLATGEPLREARSRVVAFLYGITRARFLGDVLVVSHGVINALLLSEAIGAPTARVWDFPQPNACVKVFSLRNRAIASIEDLKDVAVD